MATFFLVVIYIAFISLGLPDSLLGAAWPVMRLDLGVALDAAGLVSLVVTVGTIVSSLLSDRMTRRFGHGKVTAVSVMATAVALLGFSLSGAYAWLLVFAIPLGLGAGAVDAALNNYVALRYSARHMSWLHCFWGVGAFIGPLILSASLAGGFGWRGGYRSIAIVQFVVTALLFATLPLWKSQGKTPQQNKPDAQEAREIPRAAGRFGVLALPGAVPALLTFFFLCSIEVGVGLWCASFLTEARGLSAEVAAAGQSLFYFSITAGRFVSGVAASRFSPTGQIRLGGSIALVGAVLFVLPLPVFCSFLAVGVIGLGIAPIYPCMIHETPRRFGQANSQKIIGFQMASAYTGSTVMPPLIGLLANGWSIWGIPLLLLPISLLLLYFSQRCARSSAKNGG